MNHTELTFFAEELQKLAGETHREAWKKLKPGDIIYMSMEPRKDRVLSPKGVSDSVFRAASKSIQGNLTHSAIYVGNKKLVEARLGQGVTLKSLNKALRTKNYVVIRPRTTAKKRRKAAEFAKKQVGKAYDELALIQIGSKSVMPEKVQKAINWAVSKRQKKKVYTCSNLISAAYASAGFRRFGGKGTAPVDFRVSPHAKVVGKRFYKFKERKPLFGRAARKWKERRNG